MIRRIPALASFVGVIGLVASLSAPRLAAQTDYYNTDRGRPVQIEDAYATERYAFELKLAPARVEWMDGAASGDIEPELAYGLLPRTHLEVGVPIVFSADEGVARRMGVAGLEVSLMHNLNTETSTLPALGLRADVLAPMGPLAPDRTYATFTGMLTRTFRAMRVHLNGQVTAGAKPTLVVSPSSRLSARPRDPTVNAEGLSRWLAGIAIDKTFPLQSVLLTTELLARRRLLDTIDVELVAGAGMRVQASPTLALDLGVGRRLDSTRGPWYATFGTAYAFSVRSLMPARSR